MLKIPQLVRVQGVFFIKFYPFCVEFYSLVTKNSLNNFFIEEVSEKSRDERGGRRMVWFMALGLLTRFLYGPD
jgi:hypothetical protein